MTHHDQPTTSGTAVAVRHRAALLIAALAASIALLAVIAGAGLLSNGVGAQEPAEQEPAAEASTPQEPDVPAPEDTAPPTEPDIDAMFAEFDACLTEQGFDISESVMIDAVPLSNVVVVSTADGEQIIELGEGAASVVITSDGSVVNVETTGDVDVIELDWDEADMATFALDWDEADIEAFELDWDEADIEALELDWDEADIEALELDWDEGADAFATCEALLPVEATVEPMFDFVVPQSALHDS